jgi:FkbM family methyltransferase
MGVNGLHLVLLNLHIHRTLMKKKDLKVAWRSGSLAFARNSRSEARGAPEAVHQWRGIPVHYRPGTSDAVVVYEVLMKSGHKSEYRVPGNLSPKVILDIGGNIGVAALFFAKEFPQATIHSFEPVAENFALLQKNVSTLTNVHAHQVALGAEDAEKEIFWSEEDTNLGGFSLYKNNANTQKSTRISLKAAAKYLREQGIEQVDLIKIDTEGAEFDILTAMDEALLSKTKWIVGELHGIQDFELLAYLDKWFDIDVRRSLGKKYFNFHACNKSFVQQALESGWKQRR